MRFERGTSVAAQKQAAWRHKKALERLSQMPQVHGEGYSLYQGDAAVILSLLRTSLDVLITDPPYGVLGTPDGQGRATRGRGGKHGLVRGAYASYEDTYENFCTVVVPIVKHSLARVVRGAVFTGSHVQDLPTATVIGGVHCRAGSGLTASGYKNDHHVLFYGQAPHLNLGASPTAIISAATAEKNGHPCPKPIEWMRWLVGMYSVPGEVIFDPFMGSGTTGVACLEHGRRFVGIEVDPGYFRLAGQRLDEASRQLPLLKPGTLTASKQAVLF
jgi:DNA modification methylase